MGVWGRWRWEVFDEGCVGVYNGWMEFGCISWRFGKGRKGGCVYIRFGLAFEQWKRLVCWI